MDIYQCLMKDHEEVKSLLTELVQLTDEDDYRYILIEEIKNALIPHSRAEEQVFYNTLRAVNADTSLVMHGYKEHLEAETLLRSLQVMDRFDMQWKKVALKLKEALEHHVQEEETEIFSEAKNVLTQEEALSIGEAFEQLKPKLAQEGFIKNTVNMVVNMMPPRLADSLRNFGEKR